MFLAGFIIKQRFSADTLRQALIRHRDALRADLPVQHRHLQRVQRRPGVPVGKGGDGRKLILCNPNLLLSEAGGMLQRLFQQLHQILFLQRLQHKHLAPGQKRPVDLKGRILRGGADENDTALLHIGQEGILLRLVEPVNLVHKQNRTDAHSAAVLRLVHHLPDLFDSTGYRAEIDKIRLRSPGDDAGQRGFPHPRRSPENHGRDLVSFNQLPKHLSRTQKMLLSHKLLQAHRPHPAGQRSGLLPVIK